MRKKQIFVMIICFIILAGAVAACFWILQKPRSSQVSVIQDGKTIMILDLEQSENRTIEVEFQGHKNEIQIKNGRIRMLKAECQDQICVDMGWMETMPIVCLPNHLV